MVYKTPPAGGGGWVGGKPYLARGLIFVLSFVYFHSSVAQLWLQTDISDRFKGGNSSITDDAIRTKLDVHQIIMVTYIYSKFHLILFIGYLVMAPERHLK